MKKFIRSIVAVAILSVVTLVACNSRGGGDTEITGFATIQEMLQALTSYKSEASITYISNKGQNTYHTIQYARITGEYRVEVVGPADVAGNITFFDGTTIYQFNENIPNRIAVGTTDTPERSEIFLTSFIRNFANSEEVTVMVFNTADNNTTTLEAQIAGEHPYLHSQRLFVDNETFMPTRLVLFDKDGAERIVIEYSSFEFNRELEAELLIPPQM
ncbi:MAG: hypothetical protein FWD82_05720 [Defluviitaleaceae bacterium]|nr:hypothetical protein [Defluviitaleaceae bacterium]